MQIYPNQIEINLSLIRAQMYQLRDFVDDLGDELAKSEPDVIRDQMVLKDPRYCPVLFLAIKGINDEVRNLQRSGYDPDDRLDKRDKEFLEVIHQLPVLEPKDIECLDIKCLSTVSAKSMKTIAELNPKNLNDSSNRILIDHLHSKYPELFGMFDELTNVA